MKVKHKARKHPHDGGEVRHMAETQGYVMARRPGCYPFVVGVKEWLSWPVWGE